MNAAAMNKAASSRKTGFSATTGQLGNDADALVSKIQALRQRETGFLGLAKKNQKEADLIAFDVGEMIDEFVSNLKAHRSKGAVKHLAGCCGVSQQTIYYYIYMYRGAVFREIVEDSECPRKYFQALGSSIRPGKDFLTALIMRNLIDFPVSADPANPYNADEQAVKDIGKLLKHSVKIISDDLGVKLADVDVTVRNNPWAIEYAFDKISEKKIKPVCEEIERLFQNIESFTRISNRFEQVRKQMYIRVDGKKPFSQRMADRFPVNKLDHLPSSLEGILFFRRREHRISCGLEKETSATATTIDEKLFLGRAQDILIDSNKFPPRSVDVVITDPPYGNELYYGSAWRDYTSVMHDAKDTSEEQAEEIAEVASIILTNKINKEQFAWYSFCPLSHLHVFVPPLLKAFKDTVYQYQLLIWDKGSGPKLSSHSLYAHQLEGIIYITINRAISGKNAEGKTRGFPSPLFKCSAQTKRNQLAWKPAELIQMLVHDATDGGNQSTQAQQQLILDPFAGRGSTGVAAIRCNRDFRLIESNKAQYEIARAELAMELAEKSPASQ